jgi:predicted transposase YbfD/YdcC
LVATLGAGVESCHGFVRRTDLNLLEIRLSIVALGTLCCIPEMKELIEKGLCCFVQFEKKEEKKRTMD